jgi:hypothetical protein
VSSLARSCQMLRDESDRTTSDSSTLGCRDAPTPSELAPWRRRRHLPQRSSSVAMLGWTMRSLRDGFPMTRHMIHPARSKCKLMGVDNR